MDSYDEAVLAPGDSARATRAKTRGAPAVGAGAAGAEGRPAPQSTLRPSIPDALD